MGSSSIQEAAKIKRAAMERKIQATCLKGVYLDELHPDKGRGEPMIMDDCGILCEVMAL